MSQISLTIYRKAFYALLGFEAPKLQPESTTFFLAAVMRHFYFHGQPNFIGACLTATGGLGSHSGIFYLRSDGNMPRRYVWAHPVIAPFGGRFPGMCSFCGGVLSAAPPPKLRGKCRHRQDLRAKIVKVHCIYCPEICTFTQPTDFSFTEYEESGGVWGYIDLFL